MRESLGRSRGSFWAWEREQEERESALGRSLSGARTKQAIARQLFANNAANHRTAVKAHFEGQRLSMDLKSRHGGLAPQGQPRKHSSVPRARIRHSRSHHWVFFKRNKPRVRPQIVSQDLER